jgi:hypothetical protein
MADRSRAHGRELGLMVDNRVAVQAEHRMDRRHRQRHVRHVCGPARPFGSVRVGLQELAAERLGVCTEGRNQVQGRLEVAVVRERLVDIEARPGRAFTRLEAGPHLGLQLG